ncbi:hypothetical protein K490DRAFT_63862 [Saccharata proteae CBS 121410]|uniref:Uncharacterized protein n=1 Tax=Saccharata proteae CBS 121410 TaxID=1314787 RepID=A0A6A5YDF7_9PEZI|nr:hypothetical protein K490DRAFT_63862 [Saccharata proteae CBS 121410]
MADPMNTGPESGVIEASATDLIESQPKEHEDLSSVEQPNTVRQPTFKTTPVSPSKHRPDDLSASDSEMVRTKGQGSPEPPLRIRSTPKHKVGTPSKIAQSADELLPEDRMLIRMRDAGYPWEKVREEWYRMTGQVSAKSTLPNRYARLKDNLAEIPYHDLRAIVIAKMKIEAEFERRKWDMIKQESQDRGANAYSTATMKRAVAKAEEAERQNAALAEQAEQAEQVAEDADDESPSEEEEDVKEEYISE